MTRVLCPFDFTETAHNALRYAAQFSQSRNAELIVFHVKLMVATPSASAKGKYATLEDTSDELMQLTKEISKSYSIPCYGEIEPAMFDLAASIGDKAEDCDVVIMGTNGADDISHQFFNSNAYKAAVRSRAPFIIVPHPCKYKAIQNILYAFDYAVKGRLPMGPVLDWLENNDSSITVLQVLQDVLDESQLQQVKSFEHKTLKKHAGVLSKFETVFAPNIAEAIHDRVLEGKFDGLALCTVERTFAEGLFHKSIISALSLRATYPLFIFNENNS